MGTTQENRPFLSSKISHFQSEANCKTFLVKMSLIRLTVKNHFHTNGFACTFLAMKQRFGITWKWSIKTDCFQLKLKKQTNKTKQGEISSSLYSSLCGDKLHQYNLPLPQLSGNTNFSIRTKCWVRGVNFWVPLSRYLTLIRSFCQAAWKIYLYCWCSFLHRNVTG